MRIEARFPIFLTLAAHFLLLILILSTVPVSSAQNSSIIDPNQNSSIIGTYAYVTSSDTDTVYVIDTETNMITDIIDVKIPMDDYWGGEEKPVGVTVTPDGTKVYVTNYYGGGTSVIDTATNTVKTTTIGHSPVEVAFSPDGKKAYVANSGSNNVSVIDAETDIVIGTIKVGKNPWGVAVSPDGNELYVTNKGSSTLFIVDTAKNKFKSVVAVGSYPQGVAVNPEGTRIYVANSGSSTVSVIDTATGIATATINVGTEPQDVAITPDGTKVYVTNKYSNTVSVINTTTNIVTATVGVGSYPCGVAATPDGTKIYVTNYGTYNSPGNTISVINTTTDKVTATVTAGSRSCSFGQFIGSVPAQRILPVANFVSNITEGYSPLPVQFTDLSDNTTSIYWDFGDGNKSTEKNPVNVYVNPGNYIVNLSSINGNGTDSEFATITVLKQQVLPVANFTSSVTSGYAPITVQFLDLSENAMGWNWNFGDGTNSIQQNPIHTYCVAGNYLVNLTSTNEDGIDSKIALIVVQVKPEASNVSSPITIQIDNLSQNAKTINWEIESNLSDTGLNGSEMNVYVPFIVKIENLLQNATTINWVFN